MLDGRNKSINEQIDILSKILMKSRAVKEVLKILEEYSKENPDFKDYYLAAGCINQTVFNYYHDNNLDFGIKDYDIVYYDHDTSYEAEDKIIKDLEKRLKHLHIQFDIKNQKRVPIWYEEKYDIKKREYKNTEDAIRRWGATVTCVGVRQEDEQLVVACPYGLDDIFSMKIRPVSVEYSKEKYLEKCNRWKKCWPKLEIIDDGGFTNF